MSNTIDRILHNIKKTMLAAGAVTMIGAASFSDAKEAECLVRHVEQGTYTQDLNKEDKSCEIKQGSKGVTSEQNLDVKIIRKYANKDGDDEILVMSHTENGQKIEKRQYSRKDGKEAVLLVYNQNGNVLEAQYDTDFDGRFDKTINSEYLQDGRVRRRTTFLVNLIPDITFNRLEILNEYDSEGRLTSGLRTEHSGQDKMIYTQYDDKGRTLSNILVGQAPNDFMTTTDYDSEGNWLRECFYNLDDDRTPTFVREQSQSDESVIKEKFDYDGDGITDNVELHERLADGNHRITYE